MRHGDSMALKGVRGDPCKLEYRETRGTASRDIVNSLSRVWNVLLVQMVGKHRHLARDGNNVIAPELPPTLFQCPSGMI